MSSTKINLQALVEMADADAFEFNQETGELLHYWLTVDAEGELEGNLVPIIEKHRIFGKSMYAVQDGRYVYTYETKYSTVKKLAAVFTSQFIIALSTPGCEEAGVSKEEWTSIRDAMYKRLKSIPAVKMWMRH